MWLAHFLSTLFCGLLGSEHHTVADVMGAQRAEREGCEARSSVLQPQQSWLRLQSALTSKRTLLPGGRPLV